MMEIDQEAIRSHVEMIHTLASPLVGRGKVVLAAFPEDPTKINPKTKKLGLPLTPTVIHYEIGDVEGMVRNFASITLRQHCNVYAPLAVYPQSLRRGAKGYEKDIDRCLGLVADFDDNNSARWAERLPISPSYVLETSAGRFQAFYALAEPAGFDELKHVAERLKAFAGCDHGTADLSHVWRVPGTLNWPNARKLAAGRSSEPQLVRVAKPWAGDLVTLAELDAALPLMAEKSKASRTKAAPGAERPAGDRSSIDFIMANLPPRLRAKIEQPDDTDRSRNLFYVIAKLVERGLDDVTIEAIIRDHPGGVGEKYEGRSDLDAEIRRVRGKAEAKGEKQRAEQVRADFGRPVVKVVGGMIWWTVDQAEDLLIKSDDGLYQRGSIVVRVARTRIPIADAREVTGLRLVQVKNHHLIERFTAAVDFQRFDGREGEWVSINCPPDVAATYLEREGLWRLRVLNGVTVTPTLRPDGSLLAGC